MKWILALCCVFFMSSCLTTQHYNTGKTLPSGKSVVVWGIGQTSIYSCRQSYYSNEIQTDDCRSDERDYLDEATVPLARRQFRLGVRDSWGPFTGVDIGYAFEAPGGVEFDMRLGLPEFAETIYHSISAGWVVGFFPDNTLFLEYAISKQIDNMNIYVNFRESYLATQLYAVGESGKDLFDHDQSWVHQLGFGLRYEGKRQFFFPNVFYLHGTITTPAVSFFNNVEGDLKPSKQFTPSVGIGWTY